MILVTSAGGKTGKAVVPALVAHGHAVRAMVRTDASSAALKALGADEVVTGDLADAGAVERAVRGTRAIYYIPPNMNPNEGIHGANIIAAARAARVDRLVFHSVLHCQVQALRHHWNRLFVEESLIESGVPFTILQVSSYMQNMLPGWARMIETGEHAMGFSVDARVSLIDLVDLGEAAARVVADPAYAAGIFEISGPAITTTEKAAILACVLGRPIRAGQIPLAVALDHARHAGASAFALDCLARMLTHYSRHGFEGSTRVLSWILGRPPTDFETFARRIVAKGV